MTEQRSRSGFTGGTEVAATPSIAAPEALHAVASEPKTKKNPEVLLPPAAADRRSRIRLMQSDDRKTDDIINRPGRSTYPDQKSVLTSGATPYGSAHSLATYRLPKTHAGTDVDVLSGDTARAGACQKRAEVPDIFRHDHGF